MSLRCRRGILVVRAFCACYHPTKRFSHEARCLFPGIGYHCDKPLLYYSRKLAACAGYDHTLLLQYTYHKDGLRGSPAALREAFDTLYAQAEAQLSAVDWPQYDDVLFLSKSIGTAVSAAFAQRHGIPCRQILYTPLSLTFAFAPQNVLAF